MSLTKVIPSMLETPLSGVLGGSGNTINHSGSFVIGRNITTSATDTLFVNNISATGIIYGVNSAGTVTSVAGRSGTVTLSTADIIGLQTTLNSKLNTTGGTINGNLTVSGNLTATGTTYFANTLFSTTSALSITNFGSGAALYVGQSGNGDIASFYDIDQNVEVLHVGGNNGTFPNVGVKTSTPNKTLTVAGEISATQDITTSGKFRGDGTALTLPVATASTLGAVKQGANISIAADGTISGLNSYVLPPATVTTIGGVRPGFGLNVSPTGILSTFDLVSSVNTKTGAVVLNAADVGAAPTVHTHSYADLTNKPSFATVATTGSYTDLTNKPVLASSATIDTTNADNITSGTLTVARGGTGAANAAAARTNLGIATVGNTGSYTDLINRPAFAQSAFTDTTNAANITTGVLPVARGGTGASTVEAARAALNIAAAGYVITCINPNGTDKTFPINGYTDESPQNYFVQVGGILQQITDYYVASKNITFTEVPPAGAQVIVFAFQVFSGSTVPTIDVQKDGGLVSSVSGIRVSGDLTLSGSIIGDFAISKSFRYGVPIGTVCFFAADSVPEGFLECDGRALSKIDPVYMPLLNVIGDTFTPVLNVSNFNIPDLRGEFIRGWDRNRGIDYDAFKYVLGSLAPYRTFGSSQQDDWALGLNVSGTINTSVVKNNTETRPINRALTPCICFKGVTPPNLIAAASLAADKIDKLPGTPIEGNVLTFSEGLWGQSNPKIGINPVSFEPAIGFALDKHNHYSGCYYTRRNVYVFGYHTHADPSHQDKRKPKALTFQGNYMAKNPSVTVSNVMDSRYGTFVLLSDGSFWGCGYNTTWQNLFTVTAGYFSTLLRLNPMFGNRSVASFDVSLGEPTNTTVGVLCTDGTCFLWGYNGFGQLGNGTVVANTTPQQVTIAGRTIAEIKVGGWSSSYGTVHIRTTDGGLYFSGYTANGMGGDGTTTQKNTFTRCKEVGGGFISNVASIVSRMSFFGSVNTWVLKTDGTVWACGRNEIGIINPANTSDVTFFTQVKFPTKLPIVKLVGTSCWTNSTSTLAALDSAGRVYTWGYGGYGAHGHGSSSNVLEPTWVSVYQSDPNTLSPLPLIRDLAQPGPGSRYGALGLISVDNEGFTAGVYAYGQATGVKAGANTTNSETYYRFEKIPINNISSMKFYAEQATTGDNRGTIVMDQNGIVYVWGEAGGAILASAQTNPTPQRVNLR